MAPLQIGDGHVGPEALKAFPINPVSSSPKAMDKYRNLAVIALEVQVAHAVN